MRKSSNQLRGSLEYLRDEHAKRSAALGEHVGREVDPADLGAVAKHRETATRLLQDVADVDAGIAKVTADLEAAVAREAAEVKAAEIAAQETATVKSARTLERRYRAASTDLANILAEMASNETAWRRLGTSLTYGDVAAGDHVERRARRASVGVLYSPLHHEALIPGWDGLPLFKGEAHR